MYLFRLFLTLSHTFSHNLTLSAFESQLLKSIEHLNSCKRLSSVHLKRACEVAIFIFLKNKQGVVCGTKFSSRVGRNVDSQQTFFVFQDVFKMSWRRLQRNTFRLPRPLPKTSSRRLQDVFLKRLQDVFKTSSKRLPRRLQDVFVRRLAIMSSRCLQYVFKMCLQYVLQLCLQDVFKTSSVRLHQDECLLGWD